MSKNLKVGPIATNVVDVAELILPMISLIREWAVGKKHRKVISYLNVCDRIDGAVAEEIILGMRDADSDFNELANIVDEISPPYTIFTSLSEQPGTWGIWPNWPEIEEAKKEMKVLHVPSMEAWPQDELDDLPEEGVTVLVGKGNNVALFSPNKGEIWTYKTE